MLSPIQSLAYLRVRNPQHRRSFGLSLERVSARRLEKADRIPLSLRTRSLNSLVCHFPLHTIHRGCAFILFKSQNIFSAKNQLPDAVSMVELRKRKAPAEPVQTEKKPKVAAKATPKGRSRASEKPVQKTSSTQSPKASVPKVGEVIQLDGFGGEIETHEGAKTTLKALVDASDAGVVLFTYPKASTPGCKLSITSSGSISTVPPAW